MISFSGKSDCGKYSFKLVVEELLKADVAPARSQKVTKEVSPPAAVPFVPNSKPADAEFVVPAEYLEAVKDMWPEDLPWDMYNIDSEVRNIRKASRRESLSMKEQADIHEMHRINTRIDKMRQKLVLSIKEMTSRADVVIRETKISTRSMLEKIREEESAKERAVIAKEGVSLRRLRMQSNQSV